jgi:hypothetical protein
MNLRKSIFRELLVQSRVVLSYILRTNDVSSSAGGTQLAALHSADLVLGVGDFVTQVHSQRISSRGCIIVEMDTTVVGSWIQLGLGLLGK